MNISAIHHGRSAPDYAGSAPGRLSCESVVRHVIPLAGAVGLIILASACASMAPRQASVTGVRLRHTTAPAVAASLPAPGANPGAVSVNPADLVGGKPGFLRRAWDSISGKR